MKLVFRDYTALLSVNATKYLCITYFVLVYSQLWLSHIVDIELKGSKEVSLEQKCYNLYQIIWNIISMSEIIYLINVQWTESEYTPISYGIANYDDVKPTNFTIF